MAESQETLTRCPVCAEGFQDEGEKVPRLLPCCHSICEGCIARKLLLRSHFDCPECGTPHPASRGVDSFPVNHYVIIFVKKLAETSKPEKSEASVYEVENLDISFCSLCCVPGCVHCEKEDITSEDAVQTKPEERREDKDEQKRCLLEEDIKCLKKRLQVNKEKLVSVKKRLDENYKVCVEEINRKKIEMMMVVCERADELVNEVADQQSAFTDDVKDAVSKIDENLLQLGCVEDVLRCAFSRQDVNDELEAVKNIPNPSG